jgi:hypothetical protein
LLRRARQEPRKAEPAPPDPNESARETERPHRTASTRRTFRPTEDSEAKPETPAAAQANYGAQDLPSGTAPGFVLAYTASPVLDPAIESGNGNVPDQGSHPTSGTSVETLSAEESSSGNEGNAADEPTEKLSVPALTTYTDLKSQMAKARKDSPPATPLEEPGPENAEPPAGTAGAETPEMMNNRQQPGRFALVEEQILPSRAAAYDLEGGFNRSQGRGLAVGDPLFAAAQGPEATLSGRYFSTDQAVQNAAPSRLMGAVEETLARAAVTLRIESQSSIEVAVRPDSATELKLHVRLREDGLIEVRAELAKGTFSASDAEWKQLQHRLEQQGVDLSNLNRSPHDNGSRHRHQPAPEPELEPAALERSLRPASTEKSPSSSPSIPPENRITYWA